MFRFLAFLTKQPHLTTDEFIDYYENKHLPLIYSLSADKLPTIYKRRYLRKDAESILWAPSSGQPLDSDVVTEVVFEDRNAFQEWYVLLTAKDAAERIAADEEKFLVRERTMVYVYEEHVTER